MSQPSNANEGGPHYLPFVTFPPVMIDVPASAGPAGHKASALNSSYMNYSSNTNSITDMQSISYNRDVTQASSMPGNESIVHVSSAGCVDGGMFSHVPAPPTAMLRRTIDGDQLSSSSGRRLDSSLSFSACASYVPVVAQPQWNYIAPPAATSTVSAAATTAVVDGSQGGASYLYTSNVPANGVLVRMVDPAGNSVWCFRSDYGSGTAQLPQQQQAPQPPPPLPQPPQRLQSNVAGTSPMQAGVIDNATAGQAMSASVNMSPLAWTLHASPEAQAGRSTSSPPTDGDTDDYEYEPYNANTLASRRVGSLDRVRCKLHGKERSAQNMVMVRNKVTNEVHWRCKRSSQCKVRTIDNDDTPLSSKESTLRSNIAESLLTPMSDGAPSIAVNALSTGNAASRGRQPPAPQYTLVSPTNAPLPLDNSFHSPSQPMHAYTADMVTLPSAFTAQTQPYTPSATYYSVFAQDGTPTPLPQYQQLPQQQQQQGNIVTLNGVPYRIV